MFKRNARKIICLVLAVVMLLGVTSVLSAEVFSEYKATVYLNGTSGSDSNTGLSEAQAVATFSKAYEKLYAAMGDDLNNSSVAGRIMLTGDTDSTTSNWKYSSDHGFNLVICGKTADIKMGFTNNFSISGPTLIDDITVAHKGTGYKYICGNGFNFTIGENVSTVKNTSGYCMSLAGGSYTTSNYSTKETNLTVNSGTWHSVLGGNYIGSKKSGKTTVTINGATLQSTLSTSYRTAVNGDAIFNINGGTVPLIRLYNGDSNYQTATDIVGNVYLNIKNASVETISEAKCGGGLFLNLGVDNGKELYLGDTEINAQSFTGGGTLKLKGSSLLTISTVTGSTKVSYTTVPSPGVRIKAADTASADAFYTGNEAQEFETKTEGGYRTWEVGAINTDKALVITAPAGTSLTVYYGFSDGSTYGASIAPYTTVDNGDTVDYIYVGLETGKYSYLISGTDYYKVCKHFLYTAEESKKINADPGKHSGDAAFDPRSTIVENTDEVLSGPLASTTDMFGEYNEKVFVTPYFTNTDRAKHQATTPEEMAAFLNGLDTAGDNMYVYSLGTSPAYGHDIPLVIFSKADLSSASTIEQAAEIIKAQTNKPIIYYTAQIHGNEIAATEGALAIIHSLDGAYGDQLLDNINILIVPRVNSDGTQVYTRKNVKENLDMNRDHIYQQATESQYTHRVYNLFSPHVVIDGHEYDGHKASNSTNFDDVYLGFNVSPYNTEENNDLSLVINKYAMSNVLDNGLRGYYYTLNEMNIPSARFYYGAYGTLSFLVETRGNYTGAAYYARRVVSQYIAVEGYLNYFYNNPQQIIDTVTSTWEENIETGKTYSENNKTILDLEIDNNRFMTYYSRNFYDGGTGALISTKPQNYKGYYAVKETRTSAAAYLIPLGESYSNKVIKQLEKNGIEYYTLAPGSQVKVRQYLENGGDYADIGEEKIYTFEEGAIVVVSAQKAKTIVSILMEPKQKVNSDKNTSLVMSTVISASNGKYPIYRYEHDLESDLTVKLEGVSLAGDLNNDGEVTDQDAVYLLFYTFFPEEYPISTPADFNNDGEVTDQDAVYLLFYTFFPDEYPLNAGGSSGEKSIEITAISPAGSVDTVDPNIREYIAAAQNYIEGDYSYTLKTVEDLGNKRVPVTFSWKFEENLDIDYAYIDVSKNRDMSDYYRFAVSTLGTMDSVQTAQIYNLETGAKYYWQVGVKLENGESRKSDINAFETQEGPRILYLDGAKNARDLGGWYTSDGTKTNEGVIFRTAYLNNLTAEAQDIVLNYLGVKTEIDLRDKDKQSDGDVSSPLSDRLNYINTKGIGFKTFVTLSDDVSKYLKPFTVPSNYPILYHCVSGADRTGCLSFLLGALYGVKENDLIADFEITNLRLRNGATVSGSYLDFPAFITSIRALPGDTLQEKAYGYIKNNCGFSDMEIYNMIAMMKGYSAVFVYPTEYTYSDGWAEYAIDLRQSGGIAGVSANGQSVDYTYNEGILRVNLAKAGVSSATVTLNDGVQMPLLVEK